MYRKLVFSLMALSSFIIGCTNVNYTPEPRLEASQQIEYKEGIPLAISQKTNTVKAFAEPSLKIGSTHNLRVGFFIENHSKQPIDLKVENITAMIHGTPLYIYPYDKIHSVQESVARIPLGIKLLSSWDIQRDRNNAIRIRESSSYPNYTNDNVIVKDVEKLYLRHTTIHPNETGKGIVYVALPKKFNNDLVDITIQVGKENHHFSYQVTKTKLSSKSSKSYRPNMYAAMNKQ